jgi:hypothetical protein
MINFNFNKIKEILPLIKKIFDYFVWVMFFVLLVLGGIIFVTDRTYPGDNLYSFKLQFEDFVLATSKILNKQVDFSIDLVAKRSNEIAKILTSKNSKETLGRLDAQVVLTASSISQIQDPAERKIAATKYITKLNQVSSTLTEKKKEFVPVPAQVFPTTTPQNNSRFPTLAPSPVTSNENSDVSEQIDNSQETIEETIEEMGEIINQPTMQQDVPITPTQAPTSTPEPTDTPIPPTSIPESDTNNQEFNNNSDKKTGNKKEDETPTTAPTDIPQPTIPPDNTPIPTEVPVNN